MAEPTDAISQAAAIESTISDKDRLIQYCLDAFSTLGNADGESLKLLLLGAITDFTNKMIDDAISDVRAVCEPWGQVARTTKITANEIVKKMEARRIK
jgi:hypothetical protein